MALTFTSVVGLVGGTALALAPTAGAGAVGTELFSSGTPGFHADAAGVPPDVCFVTIVADGGSGGAFTTAPVAQVAALATIPGGSGATVSARFAVTPGQVLDAFVGGAGQSPPTGTDSGHGGNGGLGGGAGGGGGNLGNAAGAGGGGASAVSTGGQPLVVAGGGGYTSGNPNGGGGGGGYGAGAGGGAGINEPGDGAGGGGGSSFLAAGATAVFSAVNHLGSGTVRITYDPATDSCPTPPGPEPGPDGAAPGAAVAVIAQPNFTG